MCILGCTFAKCQEIWSNLTRGNNGKEEKSVKKNHLVATQSWERHRPLAFPCQHFRLSSWVKYIASGRSNWRKKSTKFAPFLGSGDFTPQQTMETKAPGLWQGRIQDFGQGGPSRVLTPDGGPEPKICSKLPENCMILGAGGPGSPGSASV